MQKIKNIIYHIFMNLYLSISISLYLYLHISLYLYLYIYLLYARDYQPRPQLNCFGVATIRFFEFLLNKLFKNVRPLFESGYKTYAASSRTRTVYHYIYVSLDKSHMILNMQKNQKYNLPFFMNLYLQIYKSINL